MTIDELKKDFTTIYTTLKAERKMREEVFMHEPSKLKKKTEEIDRAQEALQRMKDALKEYIQHYQPVQQDLLDQLQNLELPY